MADPARGHPVSGSLEREVTGGVDGLQESHVLPPYLCALGVMIVPLLALGLLVRLWRGLQGFWQGTKQNYRGARFSRTERWRRPPANERLPVSVPRVGRSKSDSDPPLPLK